MRDLDLSNIFKVISDEIGQLFPSSPDSQKALVDLWSLWKRRGGSLPDGKPRHSMRFLTSRLEEQNIKVKSINHKLNGNTRIQPSDGKHLVTFFLGTWPDLSGGTVRYKPVVDRESIFVVAVFFEEQLATGGNTTTREEKQVNMFARSELPGKAISDVLEQNYQACDVQITVSPEHTNINPAPGNLFIGFINLMKVYFEIELQTGYKRPLVWVLDIGFRNFKELDSQKKYENVKRLRNRLDSLREYSDPLSKKLWDWLGETAVFVIADPNNKRMPVSKGKIPAFSAHDISFNDVAIEWVVDQSLIALYGKGLEEIKQRTFSILFNKAADWPSDEQLRYFGFAYFPVGDNKIETRGLELPPLPHRYEEGFKTVCAAAKHTLKLEKYASDYKLEAEKKGSPAPDIIDGEEAIEQLKFLGYGVLKLEEFTKY